MMTDKDIVNGLRCCSTQVEIPCQQCPYYRTSYCYRQCRDDAAYAIERLTAEVTRLTAERDAAVDDMRGFAAECKDICDICGHNHTGDYDCEISDYTCTECKNPDCYCKTCDHGDEWVWRGVRAENGGEDNA